MLSTAAGEIVPLTSDGGHFVPEGADQQRERVHTDRRVGRMSRTPAELGSILSLESVERRTTPESTTITKTRKGFEVKNSSSPKQTGAAGKPRNPQMLKDVDELMPAKLWCDHAESAMSP